MDRHSRLFPLMELGSPIELPVIKWESNMDVMVETWNTLELDVVYGRRVDTARVCVVL